MSAFEEKKKLLLAFDPKAAKSVAFETMKINKVDEKSQTVIYSHYCLFFHRAGIE